MILAAAACAAAGISYLFNDDDDNGERSAYTKYETVTVSSTLVDQQGIVKYMIYPRLRNPYLFTNQEQQGICSFVNECKSKQVKLSIDHFQQIQSSVVQEDLSVVFFWSMPLKARLLQTCTRPCLVIENLNAYQRTLMHISIGTQNEVNETIGISPVPSEIVLSNSDDYSYQTNRLATNNADCDDTLDSLSYNPIMNDHIIPIGILKKKKSDLNERQTNQKRFCYDNVSDSNEGNRTRKMILNNVNVCVENLSKILSESCSNDEEQLTTLENSTSIISTMNNNNNNKQNLSSTDDSCENMHAKLFQYDEELNSTQVHLNNDHSDINFIERLPDGIILQRGKQFGRSLGEPMMRKYNQNRNFLLNSTHSIHQLNRLLSKTNCLLMQQHHIESIEDLIRLFLEQGPDHFTKLMINLFQVDPAIVQQLNTTLSKWTIKLT